MNGKWFALVGVINYIKDQKIFFAALTLGVFARNTEIYFMKTLILVRHAKSSWDQPGVSDIDRPLNERGKSDAPQMAKRLKERNIKIDLFISSPAKRAKKTAKYFAEEYDQKKDE